VLLIEPLSSPAIGSHGLEVAPLFVALVRSQLDEPFDDDAALLAATAVVGGLTSLFLRWLDGSLAVDRETLRDFCVRFLVTSAGLAS
jgi:hypothetical protein